MAHCRWPMVWRQGLMQASIHPSCTCKPSLKTLQVHFPMHTLLVFSEETPLETFRAHPSCVSAGIPNVRSSKYIFSPCAPSVLPLIGMPHHLSYRLAHLPIHYSLTHSLESSPSTTSLDSELPMACQPRHGMSSPVP